MSILYKFITISQKRAAPSGLDSSTGRALHRCPVGHGFESRLSLDFFFHYCLSSVNNSCDELKAINRVLYIDKANSRSNLNVTVDANMSNIKLKDLLV